MPSTTSLKLSDELKEKIASLSQDVAQTLHAYIFEAIAEKVARDEKRRAFIEEAGRSREEVGQSGKVYPHDEVVRWFAAAASGKKAARPRATRVKRPR